MVDKVLSPTIEFPTNVKDHSSVDGEIFRTHSFYTFEDTL